MIRSHAGLALEIAASTPKIYHRWDRFLYSCYFFIRVPRGCCGWSSRELKNSWKGTGSARFCCFSGWSTGWSGVGRCCGLFWDRGGLRWKGFILDLGFWVITIGLRLFFLPFRIIWWGHRTCSLRICLRICIVPLLCFPAFAFWRWVTLGAGTWAWLLEEAGMHFGVALMCCSGALCAVAVVAWYG